MLSVKPAGAQAFLRANIEERCLVGCGGMTTVPGMARPVPMHDVNAGVWAEALRLAGGHVGLLQVVSATVVIVHNRPYRPGQMYRRAGRPRGKAAGQAVLPAFQGVDG